MDGHLKGVGLVKYTGLVLVLVSSAALVYGVWTLHATLPLMLGMPLFWVGAALVWKSGTQRFFWTTVGVSTSLFLVTSWYVMTYKPYQH